MQSCGLGVSAFGEIIKKDGTRIPVFGGGVAEKDRPEIPQHLAPLLDALSNIDINSLVQAIAADENYWLTLEKCFNLTRLRIWQPRPSQQNQS